MRIFLPPGKRTNTVTGKRVRFPSLRGVLSNRENLLFAAPLRAGASDAPWSSGRRLIQAPSDVDVDANGSYLPWHGGSLAQAVLDELRFGGFSEDTRDLGVLFEVASTNISLDSEKIRAALGAWTNTRASVTDDATTAPDGTMTADKVVEDSSTNTHLILQPISFTSGTSYAYSIFAKSDERPEILVTISTHAFPGVPAAWFDLSDGTVGTTQNVDATFIDDVGNGWYCCTVTATADATTTSNIDVRLGSGSETSSYAGDGSSGLYLWGAQVEALAYPTSYIKTEGSSVARAVDKLTHDNASDVNCKPAMGTAYLAYTPQADAGDLDQINHGLLDTRDVGNADGFVLNVGQVSESVQYTVRSGGVSTANITGATNLTRGVTYIIAIVWGEDDFRLYVDGAPDVAADTNGAAPTAMDDLIIGGNLTFPRAAAGQISHVHIYGVAHTAEEIAENTSEIQGMLVEQVDGVIDDRDGLLSAIPLRRTTNMLWSDGDKADVVPTDISVDANSRYLPWFGDYLRQASTNALRQGGFSEATKRLGTLFEVASTNVCLDSEKHRAAISAWVNTRCTVTDDAATAPDGTLTADKLVEDSSTANSHVLAQPLSFTSGTTYAFGVFAKAAERAEILVNFTGTSAFPASSNAFFDLSDGTVGTIGGGGSGAAFIDDFGNGWYRCTLIATADATDSSNVQVYLSDGTEDITYDGDGSSGLYLWGAQVEALSYPTSYIVTEGSSVARAADDLEYSATDNVNQGGAMTVYMAVTPEQESVSPGTRAYMQVDDGTNGNRFILFSNTTAVIRLTVDDSSTTQAAIVGTWNWVRGETAIIAAVIAPNDFRLYLDGLETGTADTSGTVPSGLTTIRVGNSISNVPPDGIVSHVHIYNSAHDASRILTNTNKIRALLGFKPV